MYMTDTGSYYDHDEAHRAESALDTLLAQAHGAEVRHRRVGAFLRSGLRGLRGEPPLVFREAEPQAERAGRAMLGPGGINYLKGPYA